MLEQVERRVVVNQNALSRVDSKLAEAILSRSQITVSGRPLIRWSEPVSYYNDNKVETGIRLRVSFLHIMRIPAMGHNSLDRDFIGEYPALNGFEEETDVEYLFGIKPELGFEYDL